MKKLSNIKESLWSDMQDRNGMVKVRKEDGIDNLDDKGLYHYLLKHYEMVNSYWEIDYYPTANMIHIPIVNNPLTISFIDICVFDDQTVVYLSNFKRLKKVYQKIKEKYNVHERSKGFPYVTPLDGGKCTNSFAVEFLDFLLDACTTHCKVISKVNESLWSDMQDRNGMVKVRKEDSVDLMDSSEFFNYLKKHYSGEFKLLSPATIRVRVFKITDSAFYTITYYCTKKEISTTKHIEDEIDEDLYRKMKDEFYIEELDRHNISIYPKDKSEITNSFYKKVLDFVIDNIDKSKIVIERK